MLSRVAETIFWLARYMERTHGMLQVLRTNYIASQDEEEDFPWGPFLQLYSQLKPEEIELKEKSSRQVLSHLLFDKTNEGSAYYNILQSRENARCIQDHITKEVWQCLNDYYHFMREDDVEKQVASGDPVTAIDMLMRYGVLYTGTVNTTMTRDEGFIYLNIGKCLERALKTTDILRIKLTEMNIDGHLTGEAPVLRYLLYSLYGFEIYLKTFKGNFNIQNVLHLSVYNTDFPHSVMYNLDRLHKLLQMLKAESLPESFNYLDFLIGKTTNHVKYSNVEADDPIKLSTFLFQTRTYLVEIAGAFNKYYFGTS
ncbi:MAG: alpha-E domain-containing protein [Ginsengibacter sp.]